MLPISRLSLGARLSIARPIRGRDWMGFWETRFLPKGLPLLLGLGLGAAVAYSIVAEIWLPVIILALSVPAVLLLDAYPFAAVLAWLLLMPFLVSTLDSGRPGYWLLHRALIPITLGMVILSKAVRRERARTVRLGSAELAMGAFMGLALTSILLLQQDIRASLIGFYDTTLVPFCAYLLIRLTAPREKDLKRLIPIAFVIVISEFAVVILHMYATQLLPPQWLVRQVHAGRNTGTLANPAVYSTTLMFFSLLLFHAAMTRRRVLHRLMLILASGLGAVGIFFSFSRGSWLAGLFLLIGLLFLYPKQVIRIAVVAVVLIAVLGGSLLVSQMDWAIERLSQETYSGRIVVYNAMITMVRHKPLFGWGYGNLDRYDRQFYTRVGDYTIGGRDETSHNTYLTILAELGLVGFLLYVLPFWRWFRGSAQVFSELPKGGFWSWRLLVIFWLAIAGHFIAANFMDMRFFSFSLTLWWMALAFVASMVYPVLRPTETEVPRQVRRSTGSA
jgi:hypothetical protein